MFRWMFILLSLVVESLGAIESFDEGLPTPIPRTVPFGNAEEANFQDLGLSKLYVSKIKEILQDSVLSTFIKKYLTIRYEGLIHGSEEFESTEQYVEKMLDCLKENDLKKTREIYFENDKINTAHKNVYTKKVEFKYHFDSIPLLSFIKRLKPNAKILDVGAGFNNFLPHLKKLAGRTDLNYYATDPFVEGKSKEGVIFLHQPGPYKLPSGLYDLILLRATLHHVENLEKMIGEIKTKLKTSGKLILIEDSFDDSDDASICSEAKSMGDEVLNEQFNKLTSEQKIKFMIFNDWYGNHLYHKWTKMPLPFYHKSRSEWIKELSTLKMKFLTSFNMGFPANKYAVHQPFTLIMLFKKELRMQTKS